MDRDKADWYRRDVEDLIGVQNKEKPVCPIDNLPCEFVNSCDDVLSLYAGFDCVEGHSCPRAVRVRKK